MQMICPGLRGRRVQLLEPLNVLLRPPVQSLHPPSQAFAFRILHNLLTALYTHLGCGRSVTQKWHLWMKRPSEPRGHRQNPWGRRGGSLSCSWCCLQPLQQRQRERRVLGGGTGNPLFGARAQDWLEFLESVSCYGGVSEHQNCILDTVHGSGRRWWAVLSHSTTLFPGLQISSFPASPPL